MVESLVSDNVRQRTAKPGFGIPRAKHQRVQSAVDERSGTHGARFQRHVERRAFESPMTFTLRGIAERHDLGMRQGIAVDFPSIVAATDDFAVFDDNRTHRDVTMSKSFIGLLQGHEHPARIVGEMGHWSVVPSRSGKLGGPHRPHSTAPGGRPSSRFQDAKDRES